MSPDKLKKAQEASRKRHKNSIRHSWAIPVEAQNEVEHKKKPKRTYRRRKKKERTPLPPMEKKVDFNKLKEFLSIGPSF